MPVSRSEAVKYFLTNHTHADLAALYNHDLEVQVSVSQDGGEKVDKEFLGRQYAVWTDGLSTWKNFRIPLNANTEPEDNDAPMTFNLEAHVEGIGLTGWDWKNKVSKWVGFDFDSISGHAEGHRGKLTDEELAEVKRKAIGIPWVTVRKSTGGNGIHLYVFVPDVPTANHTEHAALARAVLGQMSASVGYDFKAKVDACGWILWIWHRKMRGTDGLALLKKGEPLLYIPPDWRDHLPVVTGKQRRTMPQILQAEDTRSDRDRLFDELTGQQLNVGLDAEHEKLLDFLRENPAAWSWNQDHHMLVTHTYWLREAHKALKLKGAFETTSTGRSRSTDINCFCFPMRNGAWAVRRYGNGASEMATWSKDRQGYMRCYLNREPGLVDAAKVLGGTEDERGGYCFPKAGKAVAAAAALGATVVLPEEMANRNTKLREHRDGRLIIEVERIKSDTSELMPGWADKKGAWVRIFDVKAEQTAQEEVGNFDPMIRHLVTERGKDAGWAVCSDHQWREEAKDNATAVLIHLGVKKNDVTAVVGSCVLRPWTLVRRPFEEEYPGGRLWNRNAPRLKYPPSVDLDRLSYPTWMSILTHIGRGLDHGVRANGWCRANGISTGADYLKCWIASLFQAPTKHLPYLFLFSREQNTGKSILGEALERVIVNGVMRAKQALTSQGGFNGELESMVLCTVEEGDLKGVKGAYEKIKEWVNSPTILIHPKGVTPYQAPNTSHWIQTSNDPDGCPIDPRDSRITMIQVRALDPAEIVPKEEMFSRLDKEAPDFLAAVLSLEIPPSKDRLNVPVVETEEKHAARKRHQTQLQMFLSEHMHPVDGASVKVADLYEAFYKWGGEEAKVEWNKKKIQAEMPQEYPRGRRRGDSQWVWGNLSFVPARAGARVLPRLVARGEYLKPLDEAQAEDVG